MGSMTEFKQIIGRGTRVHEDSKKFYFTIIDFRGATAHFADKDWDGEPVQVYQPQEGEPVAPPNDAPPPADDEDVVGRTGSGVLESRGLVGDADEVVEHGRRTARVDELRGQVQTAGQVGSLPDDQQGGSGVEERDVPVG